MDNKKVIIDSGPIVAFLNKSDYHHHWAKNQFSQLKPPFYTCESVISESIFLMQNVQNGTDSILELFGRELIKIRFRLENEMSSVTTLIKKYSDIPMSLADGCLVRMSEQMSNSIICTLDSDFRTYRKEKRSVIPLIIPK
ncbi:MAG: PIN domain-containing protein [Candidatus Marinimicrobia bacterium]|nr:PIN domain-containing protein [Candidatus Neomarinimicrobiota bacterium]